MPAILLCLWLAAPAFCAAPPAGPEPPPKAVEPTAALEPAEKKEADKPVRRQDAPPLALAIDLAFGATVWQQVQISTNGPVADLSKLVRDGYYKLEIVELVLLSVEGRKPLKKTVERRKKGATLAEIAAAYGLDYDRVHESTLAVGEIVDRQYLPRFPERRLRRDQDSP